MSANQIVNDSNFKNSSFSNNINFQNSMADIEDENDELIRVGEGSAGNSSGENFIDEEPMDFEEINIKFDSFTMAKQDVSPAHLLEDNGSDT